MVMASSDGDFVLTEHQKAAARWVGSSQRYLFWLGSIRSAKTAGAAFVAFARACASKDRQLHLSKTRGAYRRNVLPYIRDYCYIFGKDLKDRMGATDPHILVDGTECHVFGGSNEAASQAMQGFTSYFTLIDEAPLIPKKVVDEAIARSSGAGCKLLMTMNPESPGHWFKREFWDRAGEMGARLMVSRLEDNPHIDDDTKLAYKAAFSGHVYQRKIEARWVGAQGLVYPSWMSERWDGGTGGRYVDLAMDWGQSAPTAGIAMQLQPGGHWLACGEYYSDSSVEELRVAQHAQGLVGLGRSRGLLDRLIIDPSAAALRVELERMGWYVWRGVNDVDVGIQNLRIALESGAIRIDAVECPRLADEIAGLQWDAKATERGDDKPDQSLPDHALDALRYFGMNRLRSPLLPPIER